METITSILVGGDTGRKALRLQSFPKTQKKPYRAKLLTVNI